MIIKNAIQILDENKGQMSILDFFNQEKENDPKFFNWLFTDAENIGDFGTGLSAEQQDAFEKFEMSITSLQEIRQEYQINA